MKCRIHASVIKRGLDSSIPVATVLIGFYSSQFESESARRLFDEIPTKDLILWGAMVSAYCKRGRFSDAIGVFAEMQCSDISPNTVTLLSVLPACANLRALLHGKQIHGFAIRRMFHAQTSIQNSIMDMYAKCASLDAAAYVFDQIKEKDAISWKSIIFGCVDNRRLREALVLFHRMRASNIEPDETTLRNLVRVCSEEDEDFFLIGLGLHCYVVKIGFSDSVQMKTALLSMYAELMEVEAARALFDELLDKDHIAWSAMISVYTQAGHPFLALETFKQMQSTKTEANEITFVSLLHACSLIEAQGLGRSIHARIIRSEHINNAFTASALIDYYCKIGRLRQGEISFGKLERRDLVCWSSMINGYGINGRGEEAIRTFASMLETGMMPNEVVFVSLLSACSHCGLVNEGWRWFYSMKGKFGIDPTVAHYTCMLNMLGRQGRVEEALEFVKKMPVRADATVWGALLGWCRATHRDVKVAEFAAEQIVGLGASDSSWYVTLAKLYWKLGMWEDGGRMRERMEERGIRKIAGYSMV